MSLDAVAVHEVLLTEDRGMIHRRGVLLWPGGAGVITIEGVAPVLVDASLQITADVGVIGRVAVRRSWAGEDTTALAETARDRREVVVALNVRLARLQQRRERAGSLLGTLAKCISAAAAAGEGDAARWTTDLERIHERFLDNIEAESDVADEHTEAAESLAKIAAAMEAAGKQWRLRARVEIALEAPAGEVVVSLRYLVPAALWRPAYRATLSEDGVELCAQASIWQRTGEDWPAVPVTLSTARPSTGATLPPLYTDPLGLRDKTAIERRVIQAQSWDQAIKTASLTEEEGLPGVDDGGETRTLTTARPLAVPSNGRPHRANIATATCGATVRYRCMPEQAALVFREVELVNPLPHPLLAGPVTLVAEGGACGIGEIPFVAPGERFPLSFGSEDNISVSYHREAEIEERFALADHRWLIQRVELTNTGDDEKEIELILRTPVSELKQVKIILDTDKRTAPGMSGPDEQGFVRWQVRLPSGERLSRRVAFRIEKANNVSLSDFW